MASCRDVQEDFNFYVLVMYKRISNLNHYDIRQGFVAD